MQRELTLLERIQRLDLEIEGIEKEKERYTQELEKVAKEIEGIEGRLKRLQDEITGLEREKSTLEEEVRVDVERIKRDEERIKGVKREKEYRALEKEINAAKKDKKVKEDRVLEVMGEIDKRSVLLKEVEERLKERSSYLEGLKAGQADKNRVWDEGVEAKQKEREGFAVGLPPSLLKRYETLREKRQGIAVVPVKNGTCQGCYMNVPPQLYIQVRSQNEIISCPHCHRILYFETLDSSPKA
ncbi:MAG: hypothetical protein HY878_03195 [Deltaproteobacteria bacterium]|nr:hypothetical protein [Deltaproteobacteria bacterium]